MNALPTTLLAATAIAVAGVTIAAPASPACAAPEKFVFTNAAGSARDGRSDGYYSSDPASGPPGLPTGRAVVVWSQDVRIVAGRDAGAVRGCI